MLGWFSTKCPVTTPEKVWTELRMCWLAEQFGVKRLLSAQMALPNEEFFPTPYEATLEYAQRLMQRIGDWMQFNTDGFTLEIRDYEPVPGEGHYNEPEDPVHICVSRWQLENLQHLTATLAHRISHRILIGDGWLAPDETDRESVIDLLPVLLGMGIFMANATVTENNYGPSDRTAKYSRVEHWSVGRQGYLPARVFGYALALFALLREEQNPDWAEHLRPDAAEPFQLGLHYLQKTNDTICHNDTIGRPRRPPSEGDLIRDLEEGTPSARLAALWQIRDRRLSSDEAMEAVAHCLNDRDPDIPRAACDALGASGPAAERFVQILMDELQAESEETRIGAALALGAIGRQADVVIPALGVALEDDFSDVVEAAAIALYLYGRQAELAVPQLLSALSKAFADGNQPVIDAVLRTLVEICPGPVERLREFYAELHPDLYDWAVEELLRNKLISGSITQGDTPSESAPDG